MRALACLMLAACAGPPRAPAAPTTAAAARDADLVGTWTGQRELSQGPAGPLALTHAGATWTATLAGTTVTLAADGDWLRSDLGTGEIRLRPATPLPEVFWLQGSGVTLEAAYATPVAVHATATGFAGDVVTLADRITLALVVAPDARDPHGALTAYIREPGFNYGGMVRALTVTRSGAQVTFSGANGKPALAGTLSARGLHVALAGIGVELDLARTAPLAGGSPTLATPPVTGDGWRTDSLAAAGLAAGPLRALLAAATAAPTAWDSPAVQALLIARHGKLVVESYAPGFTADTPHDTRSAGKSWTSTLAGAAVDRGELTPATRLAPTATDPRKAAITLEHLLTMSAGLACDDDDDASPGNESTLQSQKAEPDWWKYMLALPMLRAPGERAVYCSGAINLVGALLAGQHGDWLPARWNRDLAAPLGITHYYLNLMPTEQGYLAGGTYLRARDFAKLAQVFLDHGVWNGRRIVSADWVARATAPRVGIHVPLDYGYAWWQKTYRVGGVDYPAFYASGNGGQIAMAIPSLDLVFVIMAGNYGNFATWGHFVDDWIPQFVIPAAR